MLIVALHLPPALQGVHVPAAGRLMAVVEPAQPIRMPLAPYPQQQQGRGRRGRRQAGRVELVQRDELLRAAARRVAAMASKGQLEASDVTGDLADPTDPSDAFEETRAWQVCEFMLDLRVRPAAAHGEGGARQGLAQDRSGGSQERLGGGPSALRQHMMRGSRRQAALEEGDGGGGSQVDVLLNGTLVSRSCGMRLSLSLATAHVEEYYNKAVSCGGRRRRGACAEVEGVGDAGQLSFASPLPLLLRPHAALSTPHSWPPSTHTRTSGLPLRPLPQVNYTLMITALGFLQVLLLVRQMEACSTPALASRVSLLTLAHQVRCGGWRWGAHTCNSEHAVCGGATAQ